MNQALLGHPPLTAPLGCFPWTQKTWPSHQVAAVILALGARQTGYSAVPCTPSERPLRCRYARTSAAHGTAEQTDNMIGCKPTMCLRAVEDASRSPISFNKEEMVWPPHQEDCGLNKRRRQRRRLPQRNAPANSLAPAAGMRLSQMRWMGTILTGLGQTAVCACRQPGPPPRDGGR